MPTEVTLFGTAVTVDIDDTTTDIPAARYFISYASTTNEAGKGHLFITGADDAVLNVTGDTDVAIYFTMLLFSVLGMATVVLLNKKRAV